MVRYWLDDDFEFPSPEEADETGLLVIGGRLQPDRLIQAYSSGIFPWPHDGLPMLWFSPDPRMVLMPGNLRVPRSLRSVLRQGRFEIRLDGDFRRVIEGCATASRKHDDDRTWITPEVQDAYTTVHEMGYAHCVEAWFDGDLVGGAYGISVGGAFVGESMFARETDASKAAFATLVRQLSRWGIDLVDGQVPTGHLARLGFAPVPRTDYLSALREAVEKPTRLGPWRLDDDIVW